MGFLSVLLLVIFVIASFLLIVVVLIQDEQGEGIGGLFGGGGATSFGSRSGNILTKATSVLGAVFLAGAFILAWLNKTPEAGDLLGAARRGRVAEQTVDEWWIVDDKSAAPEASVSTSTESDGETSDVQGDASEGADSGRTQSSDSAD